MAERPDDPRTGFLQVLEELQRLEDEQRTVDLRDPSAVDALQQRIDALRQKVKLLDARRTGGPRKPGETGVGV